MRDQYICDIGDSGGLRRKGTIRIIEKKPGSGSAALEIGGETVEAGKLGELLAPYIGSQMQYMIREASEDILRDDEYLIPVKITEDSLIDDIDDMIHAHADSRGFLTYDKALSLEMMVYPILNRLEVLAASDKRPSAVSAGKRMMRRLSKLEHERVREHDDFPEHLLILIADIIDPHRTDEEVQRLLQDH